MTHGRGKGTIEIRFVRDCFLNAAAAAAAVVLLSIKALFFYCFRLRRSCGDEADGLLRREKDQQLNRARVNGLGMELRRFYIANFKYFFYRKIFLITTVAIMAL